MNSQGSPWAGSLLMLMLAVIGGQAFAQQGQGPRTEPVAGSVHVLYWRGGNIAISAGEDGVFLVDDQYAPQTPEVLRAVRAIRDEPVRFVLNTHWHEDHTGGNEALAGQGALIVAHQNVRQRLNSEQFIAAFGKRSPPAPASALPVITYDSSVRFHLNDDTIVAEHLGPAHTDGDSIVRFLKADVIHTGDLFFNGLYPFVDLSSGGDVAGLIRACDQVLAMAGPKTRIIPGHGPLSDRAGLQAYRDMLAAIHERVAKRVRAGESLAEIQTARPSREFDAAWGGGFLSPEKFVEIVHASVKAHAH